MFRFLLTVLLLLFLPLNQAVESEDHDVIRDLEERQELQKVHREMRAEELRLLKLAEGQEVVSRSLQVDGGSTALVSGLGSGLFHSTFDNIEAFPLNTEAAMRAGWVSVGDGNCKSLLGVEYARGSRHSIEHPVVLFYTESTGLLAGIGVYAKGQFSGAVVKAGLWEQTGEDEWFVSVTFREADEVCSNGGPAAASTEKPIGDRAVVNARSVALLLPLDLDDEVVSQLAVKEGSVFGVRSQKGACATRKGTPNFLWLSAPEEVHEGMPSKQKGWSADALAPVTPLYDEWSHDSGPEKRLSGLLIATPFEVQQNMEFELGGSPASNDWDAVPLTNPIMCESFCDEECAFTRRESSENRLWSTLTILFTPPENLKCQGLCQRGCCGITADSSETSVAE